MANINFNTKSSNQKLLLESQEKSCGLMEPFAKDKTFCDEKHCLQKHIYQHIFILNDKTVFTLNQTG